MRITPLEDRIQQKIRGKDVGQGAGHKRLSREEIKHYQLAKLKETIDWSRSRSSFYRKHLQGVEIHSLDDLGKLPFTTAQALFLPITVQPRARPAQKCLSAVTAPSSAQLAVVRWRQRLLNWLHLHRAGTSQKAEGPSGRC